MDIKGAFLLGIIAYLSNVLEGLKASIAAGSEADEQIKGAAVIYVLYEDELQDVAKKSANPYDDAVLMEIGEVARGCLSPVLVSELENLRAKAPAIVG